MKRLVIEVLTTEWGKLWRVKEQTHREGQFVGTADRPDSEFEHDGFLMGSQSNPSARHERGIFLRGSKRHMDDEISLVPSDEWLDRLRAAVRAYNEHFSDKPALHQASPNVEVIE